MPLLLLILFIFLLSFTYAARKGAPWVPTVARDRERAFALLDLKKGQTLVELGCGDARFLIEAWKRFGVHGVGVELSLAQYLVARLRVWFARAHVKIIFANLFTYDLSKADVVYCFLLPKTYAALEEKFKREMRPAARLVTFVWPLPSVKAQKEDHTPERPALYRYEF